MEISTQNSGTWSDVAGDPLSDLMSKSDHFEIKGSLSSHPGGNSVADVTAQGGDHAPGLLQRAYRAASRNQSQKDEYRRGMENVRALLREKYDQHAVVRFDNHFAYRRWAGKPLTIRAFKVFIHKEEELRQGTVNVSTEKKGVDKLEDLNNKLFVEKDKQEWSIIGGSKVPSAAKTDYAFPFLPIKRSWFEFSANAEDLKKGREAGIDEARKAILGLVPNKTTKTHVEHLFNCHFAAKIEKKETLTVEDLSLFIDDAIKIRDNENKILGGLYSACVTAKDAGEDVTVAVYNFLKSSYHALGIAAGAAVVANAEAGVNDPIAALVKGLAAVSLVTAENDTERIMTAVAEHFVATPAAAPQTSITSSVLKFFTFGLY